MFGDEDDIELPEDQNGEVHDETEDEETQSEGADETDGESDGDEGQDGESEEAPEVLKGEGGDEPPAKPASRAQRAVLAAKAQAKAADERAAKVEHELAQLRSERQRASQENEEQAERERLALMTTEEKVEYHLTKLQRQQEAFQRQQQFMQVDQSDRAAYLAKAAADPRYKKYEAEVERGVQAARSRGYNLTREETLALILGYKVLSGKTAAAGAKGAAGERVRRQTTKPSSGSSDQGGRKRGEKSREERLANVVF